MAEETFNLTEFCSVDVFDETTSACAVHAVSTVLFHHDDRCDLIFSDCNCSGWPLQVLIQSPTEI